MDTFRQVVILFFTMFYMAGCASSIAKKDVISETLKPEGLHEDCMELSPGQSIEYSFDASKPLNFNVHYHEDAGISYPLKRDNTSHEEGRFRAEKKQHYCLMWTNSQSEAVTLNYRYRVENK